MRIRHFGMDDTSASGHPLQVAGSKIPFVSSEVLVLRVSFEDVGNLKRPRPNGFVGPFGLSLGTVPFQSLDADDPGIRLGASPQPRPTSEKGPNYATATANQCRAVKFSAVHRLTSCRPMLLRTLAPLPSACSRASTVFVTCRSILSYCSFQISPMNLLFAFRLSLQTRSYQTRTWPEDRIDKNMLSIERIRKPAKKVGRVC